MFTYPYYITMNVTGEKIFVSDGSTHTITCMTVDGDIVYQNNDKDLRCPSGLYCDSGDNILVCGWWYHNVHVITADGKKNRSLLSPAGLQDPYSIAYRDSDDTLLVGCRFMKDILIFQLTK